MSRTVRAVHRTFLALSCAEHPPQTEPGHEPARKEPPMSDHQLIEAPKRRGGLIAVVAIIVIAVIAALIYFLTTGDDDDTTGGSTNAAATSKTVKIGVVGASDPYWAVYKDA